MVVSLAFLMGIWWEDKGENMSEKFTLYGFNNLTKSLSFNIYDVCYAKSQREQKDYIAYIDQQYNSERLTKLLVDVTDMIGASVLNISSQDYEPQGSSVTILIADESKVPVGDTATAAGEAPKAGAAMADSSMADPVMVDSAKADPAIADPAMGIGDAARLRDAAVAHLDKSHITVHTYPEYHPDTYLATFRVDIDVATCGEITPLSTLDYLIGSFDSDIITMDYRVRGFTRDINGQKLFMDHRMTSIQDYIDAETLRRYDAVDINVYEANLFHTKMLIKEIDLQNYLFNSDVYELAPKLRLEIMGNLRREMIEIFSGRNIY
mgnify:CR=1 FL=1